jgi:predicted nucleic acid-binding protein
VKAIADTGFLVAFANRNDQYHAWAVEVARQIHEPLLTCEAVLSEAAFHLGSTALVLQFVLDGMVKLDFDAAAHLPRLAQLATRYADRRPDLADLCLIRMSELHRECPVITTNVGDFRVYRRGRREAIPIIHPPLRRK